MSNNKKLFEIIGSIDEKLITEADIDVSGIIKHKGSGINMNILMKAAVVVIIMIGAFSTTMAVNAEFRHAVIEFFHVNSTEVVPDRNELVSNNPIKDSSDGNKRYEENDKEEASNELKVMDEIILYETDEIDNVFTSSYVEADGYIDVQDGIYVYSKDNNVTFYYLEGEDFIPIDTAKIRREVEIRGIKGTIDYYYCEYNQKVYLYNNDESRFAIDDKTDGLFSLSGPQKDDMWLSLYKNPQSDNFNYPVKFNMNNGKTDDFLKDIKVNEHSLWEEEYLSGWTSIDENTLIVSIGKKHDLYRISLDKKTAVNLTKTMSLPVNRESSYKILEHYLFVIDGSVADTFDYIRYDILTGEKTVIYDNFMLWNLDTIDKSDSKVVFTGGKYDLIKKDNLVYISDEITGEIIPIDGLTDELAISAVANSADDKICVDEFGEDHVTKLGIIDMSRYKYYLLNRINSKNEYSLTWLDNEHIAIQAEEDTKSYIYMYSLKEGYGD